MRDVAVPLAKHSSAGEPLPTAETARPLARLAFDLVDLVRDLRLHDRAVAAPSHAPVAALPALVPVVAPPVPESDVGFRVPAPPVRAVLPRRLAGALRQVASPFRLTWRVGMRHYPGDRTFSVWNGEVGGRELIGSDQCENSYVIHGPLS